MADDRVELEVNGRPVSTDNPLPTTPPAGGAGAVDQGAAGVDPWKVDDDATQTAVAAVTAELVAIAAAKTLADIVTALGFSKNAGAADATTLRTVAATDGPTVAVLGATTDAAAGDASGSINAHVRQIAKLLAAALTVSGTVTANLQPTTSGGSTPYKNLDLGTTGQVVKNGAGQVYNYYVANRSASERFLKFYDKATAPTSGDTPVWTYPLPPNFAANVAFPNGIAFAAGISVRATTGIADADNTAPSANDVVVNLGYK